MLYVVPTLGRRPDYLAETLDSIRAQNHPAAVVVVAPAGASSARESARERGIPFVAEPRPGLSAAVNEGLRVYGDAHEFWAWLGDDDTLVDGSTDAAVGVLRSDPSAAMVYGRCEYVDAEGNRLHEVRPGSLAARLLRWGPNLVPQPGSVARASAVRRVGLLDEGLRYAMDLDLFLRLKDVGGLRYVPRVLATFRWHQGSTTVGDQSGSSQEARTVRVRSWTGSRRLVGPVLAPPAHQVGRLLHRVQRFS